MTSDQRVHQAAAFLEYNAKCPLPWDQSFSVWAASKALDEADYYAVRSIVHAELIARGEVVLTDAPDFEPEDVEVQP